ncbi:Mov34/MPN/PAD-1 family protein [Jatrophihabitans sp. DSM 45814]
MVARSAADALAAACEQAFPLEVVGFLVGARHGDDMAASEFVLARGAAGGRGEFDIPDHEVSRIQAWAQDRRLHIVALVHSHPSGDSRLSETDQAALRYSDWPWSVVTRVSRTGIEFAAYQPGDAARLPCRVDWRFTFTDDANPKVTNAPE